MIQYIYFFPTNVVTDIGTSLGIAFPNAVASVKVHNMDLGK